MLELWVRVCSEAIIEKITQQCQSGIRLILKGDMLNYSFQQKNFSCTQFDGWSKNQELSTGLAYLRRIAALTPLLQFSSVQ